MDCCVVKCYSDGIMFYSDPCIETNASCEYRCSEQWIEESKVQMCTLDQIFLSPERKKKSVNCEVVVVLACMQVPNSNEITEIHS